MKSPRAPTLSPEEIVEYQLGESGRIYKGIYYVEDGNSIVVTSSFGQKGTQLGGSPAQSLARLLLAEIINEAKTKNLLP